MPIMNIFYVIVAQVTFYVSDLTEAFFYLIIFNFFFQGIMEKVVL